MAEGQWIKKKKAEFYHGLIDMYNYVSETEANKKLIGVNSFPRRNKWRSSSPSWQGVIQGAELSRNYVYCLELAPGSPSYTLIQGK